MGRRRQGNEPTVDEVRKQMQQKPGSRFDDIMGDLTRIRQNKVFVTVEDKNGKKTKQKLNIPASTIVQAAQTQIKAMGYDAPEKVEIEQRGLLISLSAHSADDLQHIKNAFTPSKGVQKLPKKCMEIES